MTLNDAMTVNASDLGVWVCDARAAIIGHALFMKSICIDFPKHVDIRFNQHPINKHRYFQKHELVSLYYCKYEFVSKENRHLHLFGIGESAATTFIKECSLSDLQFPVKMAGIILIVAKQKISLGKIPVDEINWAREQSLPCVIAATGYDSHDFSEDEFRDSLKIDTSVAVIAGPAIELEKENGYDSEHAKSVLEALSLMLNKT